MNKNAIKKQLCLISLLTFISPLLTLKVRAEVVGFNDVSGATPMSSQQFGVPSYTEHGMTFTPMSTSSSDIIRLGTSCGYASSGPARSPCSNDNSPHFLIATLNEKYRATLNNGNAFKLMSVELTNYSWAPGYSTISQSVTFVGNLMSGGTVSQTFTTDRINTSDPFDNIHDFETFYFGSDFVNLSSLEITTGHYSLDNFTFEAAIPEPSTISLMGICLIPTYLIRKRRMNSSGSLPKVRNIHIPFTDTGKSKPLNDVFV